MSRTASKGGTRGGLAGALLLLVGALLLAGGTSPDAEPRDAAGAKGETVGSQAQDRAALAQRIVDIDLEASQLGERALEGKPSEADRERARALRKELRSLAERVRTEFPDLEEELRHPISESLLDLAFVIRGGGEGPMSLRLGRRKEFLRD